jgi:hypothetical protein
MLFSLPRSTRRMPNAMLPPKIPSPFFTREINRLHDPFVCQQVHLSRGAARCVSVDARKFIIEARQKTGCNAENYADD